MPQAAIAHPTVDFTTQFAEDVRAGLRKTGQKELPSKYFYDDIGSALFEVISLLPAYGLTRAGERILRRHVDEITSRIDSPLVVAELGSGSGKKPVLFWKPLRAASPHSTTPLRFPRGADHV